MLRALGATPAVADALDRDALIAAVVNARPTHVIHQLTALPKGGPRQARDLEATNRLRIDGTRNLLDAAIEAGARRFVVGSFAHALGSRSGRRSVSTMTPQQPCSRWKRRCSTRPSARSIEGVILRYGLFYGPETPSTVAMIEMVRKRWLPVVRGDAGQLPMIHVDDAVSATVAALDRAPAGAVYDIVDDQAVSMSRDRHDDRGIHWICGPVHGARVAAAAARPLHGAHDWRFACRSRTHSAKAELGWQPALSRPRAKASRRCFDTRPEPWIRTSSTPIARCCSRSRTGCSAARPMRKTCCRTRGCVITAADRSAIRSPKAFATTIVTRLCLDRLKSARATREEYIGPWLPEPVLTSDLDSPDTVLQRVGVGHARVSRASREAVARRARGVPAQGHLRLRPRGDR